MTSQVTAQRPQPVVIAVYLLWACVGVSLLQLQQYLLRGASTLKPENLTDLSHTIAWVLISKNPISAILFFALCYTLFAFFIVQIFDGKNWARITCFVGYIFGLLPNLFSIKHNFDLSFLDGVLSVTQICFQTCAFFMLFGLQIRLHTGVSYTSVGWYRKDTARPNTLKNIYRTILGNPEVEVLERKPVHSENNLEIVRSATLYSQFIESERVQRSVGAKHDKYLAKWRKILEKTGDFELGDPKAATILAGATSWNWAAFFFHFIWGIWRGIKFSWLALTIWVLMVAVGIVFPNLEPYCSAANWVFPIVYGMYGNSWYLYTLAQTRAIDVEEVQPSTKRLVVAIVVVVAVALISAFASEIIGTFT